MTEALNEIVMEVLEGTISVSAGYFYFEMVIQHYRQLDPPILQLLQIEIETEPNKTKYLVGETFDPAGMVVKATYSDGSTAEVSGYTYSPNGALTDSDNSITISYTEGGETKTSTQEIAVYPTANVYYGDNLAPSVDERNLQSMDIYIPKNADGTYKAGSFPVVITIHGGGWCDGDKATSHYHNNTDNNSDMSDFITNTCNCVHVNMNYRLTTGVPGGNNITYKDMLNDIEAVIAFISNSNNASIYHIDTTKNIVLMGHSAGGHLALLYGYKAATCANCIYNENCWVGEEGNENCPYDRHKVSPAIPVTLVISEAGPTYFYKENEELEGQDEIITDENICAMVGSNNAEALYNASPLTYVNSNSPNTILAYGDQLDTQGQTEAGDGIVLYFQAEALVQKLRDNNVYNDLKTLIKVWHGDFGKAVHYDMSEEAFNQRRNEYLETVSCGESNCAGDTCSACQQKRNSEMNRYTYIWNTQLSNINAYYDAIRNNL